MVVSEESRSSEGQGSGRVLSLDEEDEDLRDFPLTPRVVGSSERYILSTTILTTTTATPVSPVLEELDFAPSSPPEEGSDGEVFSEEVTFPGDFEGGDVEVVVEEREEEEEVVLGEAEGALEGGDRAEMRQSKKNKFKKNLYFLLRARMKTRRPLFRRDRSSPVNHKITSYSQTIILVCSTG